MRNKWLQRVLFKKKKKMSQQYHIDVKKGKSIAYIQQDV